MVHKILFRVLGFFLIFNWLVLLIYNIFWGYWGYMLWLSNIVLLITGISLIFENTNWLSVSFVSIFFMHALWIFDFFTNLFMGSSFLGFTEYLASISFLDVLLTSHHFYLLPIIIYSLYIKKKFNENAWLLSSALFLFLLLASFLLTGPLYNVNCSHDTCGVLEYDYFYFNYFLEMGYVYYFLAVTISMTLFNFLVVNKVFHYLFKKFLV